MVPRQPWFERRFTFDLPVSAAPGLIERLRGTPARLQDRLVGVTVARLTARFRDHWSIQENVGHLWDLEPLWSERVDDLAAGRRSLHPADLENRRTHEAHHNEKVLADLLAGFRSARCEMVTQLESADEADWERSALHPRLQKSMRLLDLAFFISEHDDHHLATISELLRWHP